MEDYSPERIFWQNENQQFTTAIVFAAFSLIIVGLYLLPSTTCIIPTTNDLLLFCSDDLNTKNFWIGVISSGFFFSTEQIIVKVCGLLLYGGFCGFIIGLFTYIRSFQQEKDFCCS